MACWAGVVALGMYIVWRPCGLGECVTHGLLLSRQRPRGLERTQDMRTGPRAAWRSDHRGGRCSTPRAPLLCDSGLAPAAPGYAPTSLWHPRLLVATRHLNQKGRGETEHAQESHSGPLFYAAATDQTGLNVFIGNQRSSATATNMPWCRSLPVPPPYTAGTSNTQPHLHVPPRTYLSRAPLAECRGIEYPRNPCLARFAHTHTHTPTTSSLAPPFHAEAWSLRQPRYLQCFGLFRRSSNT